MEKKCNDLQKVFQDDSNRLKEILKKKTLKGRRKVVTFYPRCRVKKTRERLKQKP